MNNINTTTKEMPKIRINGIKPNDITVPTIKIGCNVKNDINAVINRINMVISVMLVGITIVTSHPNTKTANINFQDLTTNIIV